MAVSLVQTRCLLAWPLKYPWKGQGRQCHPGPRVGTEVVTGQWWTAWRHWFCGQNLCSYVSPTWINSFLPPEELPSSNGARADNSLELMWANIFTAEEVEACKPELTTTQQVNPIRLQKCALHGDGAGLLVPK